MEAFHIANCSGRHKYRKYSAFLQIKTEHTVAEMT